MADPTRKELVSAAKDMNKVLGLEPPIDVALKPAELIEQIKIEAKGTGEVPGVHEKDQLKDSTWEVLSALEVNPREAKKEKKGKKEKKADKKAPAKKDKKDKKESAFKGPGIIQTIVDTIVEKGPVTKDGILAVLVKKFPEREEKSMKATINVQVPGRINMEKNLNIVLTDDGYQVAGKGKKSKGKK